MFTVQCKCGADLVALETQLDRPIVCQACGGEVICLAGETIDSATAGGDFDATLLVIAGPTRKGEFIRLGGAAEISIGKQEGSHLLLPGTLVSRAHCKLVRADFGPSCWQIDDKNSTNGLYVNGHRVTSYELNSGDTIDIGEYTLEYQVVPMTGQLVPTGDALMEERALEVADAPLEIAAPVRPTTSVVAAREIAAGPVVHTAGPTCPSCEKLLGPRAKVCVECGIRVPSGRPLLTASELDESVVHGNAELAVKLVSWLVPLTPLPMPLASQAYGKHKPYALWAIGALTVIASLWFLVMSWSGDKTGGYRSLMLWPANVNYDKLAGEIMLKTNDLRDLNIRGDADAHFNKTEMRAALAQMIRDDNPPFQWYQLFTCALLHDPDSIFGFILHLGGNMLFFLVFGSCVNAVIGNTATAIIYPILAAASAGIFLLTLPSDAITPLLGASGAINGLAGMYLVLFPAHLVYCAMWVRIRWHLWFKIFTLRGFWVLLIYFAYDVAMVIFDVQGNTAHWAHIGGFITGVLIGVGLLASRKFDCRNGDLLSMVLGKHAWAIIGKPNRIERGTVAVG